MRVPGNMTLLGQGRPRGRYDCRNRRNVVSLQELLGCLPVERVGALGVRTERDALRAMQGTLDCK
jgi:hypothetical protein